MIKKVIEKILISIFDKPLQLPTDQEKEFVRELKDYYQGLVVKENPDAPPSEIEWLNNIRRLRDLVLNQDPREFLRWNVISNTMFVSARNIVSTELKYLKSRPDWEGRWKKAIKESIVGHPLPYPGFLSASGNTIHHAYHAAKYEEKTGLKIKDMDIVFEFGGGYGSLCRMFFNLGFKGKYVIYDMPSISALQKYYLKSIGVQLLSHEKFDVSKNGVVCLSDIRILSQILLNMEEELNSLFIATWSISETPIAVRNSIIPLVSKFKSFLIAYQDKFGEMNNLNYFNALKNDHVAVSWDQWKIEHIPGNNYLIGWEK